MRGEQAGLFHKVRCTPALKVAARVHIITAGKWVCGPGGSRGEQEALLVSRKLTTIAILGLCPIHPYYTASRGVKCGTARAHMERRPKSRMAMPFNPFSSFRKYQKFWMATILLVCMVTFVLCTGVGGDLSQRLLDYFGRRSGSAIAKLDNRTIYAQE